MIDSYLYNSKNESAIVSARQMPENHIYFFCPKKFQIWVYFGGLLGLKYILSFRSTIVSSPYSSAGRAFDCRSTVEIERSLVRSQVWRYFFVLLEEIYFGNFFASNYSLKHNNKQKSVIVSSPYSSAGRAFDCRSTVEIERSLVRSQVWRYFFVGPTFD
jgi:hypothetical protein